MAITATTIPELLVSIDTNIRNKTKVNSITPDTHSDILTEVVIVLSGGTDMSTTINLTSNDILRLNEIPLTIINAQGPKTTIMVKSAIVTYFYGTTPYSLSTRGHMNIRFIDTNKYIFGSGEYVYDNPILLGTSDITEIWVPNQYTISDNIGLEVSSDGQYIDGDGVIQIKINYKIIDI